MQGSWHNEYGSCLSLDLNGSNLSGRYASSTGSSGSYFVLGRTVESGGAVALGQPTGLVIAWRSAGKEPPDPSWHFVSVMTGQIFRSATEDLLDVNHLMIAPTALPGVCGAGGYIDRLRFRRGPDVASSLEISGSMEGSASPLWLETTDGGRFELLAEDFRRDLATKRIRGRYIGPAGISEVAGFIDRGVEGLRAFGLCWADPDETKMHVAAGTLDSVSWTAEASLLTTQATSWEARYVQTAITGLPLHVLQASD